MHEDPLKLMDRGAWPCSACRRRARRAQSRRERAVFSSVLHHTIRSMTGDGGFTDREPTPVDGEDAGGAASRPRLAEPVSCRNHLDHPAESICALCGDYLCLLCTI